MIPTGSKVRLSAVGRAHCKDSMKHPHSEIGKVLLVDLQLQYPYLVKWEYSSNSYQEEELQIDMGNIKLEDLI